MMAYPYPYSAPYGAQSYFQGAPGGYSQPMQMQIQQPTAPVQAAQATQDDRIWVSSESAAESFLVAANGFVRLWDSNKPVFYEKRADMNGRPMPLVAYEYKIRDTSAGQEAVSAGFEQRLSAVEEKLKKMMEGQNNDA